MRILISALLLALSNMKKDSKCSSENELTDSYVPAGLQVLSYYLSQLQGEDDPDGRSVRDGNDDPKPSPSLPTIVITYQSEDDNSTSVAASKTIQRLEKLAAVLDSEADDRGLDECKGFTSDVLRQLERSSRSSSAEQLAFILNKISGEEMKRPATVVLVKGLLLELEKRDSDMRVDLECVRPLKYLSDLSVE